MGFLEADIWRKVDGIVGVDAEGENHKEQCWAFGRVLLLCCNCCFIHRPFCPCVFVCTGLGPFSNIVYNSYNPECFFFPDVQYMYSSYFSWSCKKIEFASLLLSWYAFPWSVWQLVNFNICLKCSSVCFPVVEMKLVKIFGRKNLDLFLLFNIYIQVLF